MFVRFHITVPVNEHTDGLLPLCYHGVKQIKFDTLYRKLTLFLEEDYKGPTLNELQSYNTSAMPYVHSYYDIADFNVEEYG